MVLKLTLHLSGPGRGSIASAGGSGAIAFAVARPAIEGRNAGLPAFDRGSSSCHNRGSNSADAGAIHARRRCP